MIRAVRKILGGTVAGLLACAGLTGLVVVGLGHPAGAAVRNTGLGISPVFSKTLVGDFDQAGNTLLDCQSLTDGSPLPSGGCQRDVKQALATGGSAFYNNQIIQKYLDRDVNTGTHASSSATVTVPSGAQVVFAELSWLGTTQKDANPQLQWNPDIWMLPMKMSVGNDQSYVAISPDQGTSIAPGTPGSDTNDFYYSASANVTQYLAGRTGQITVWGADAPFPANGFNQAGLGWNIVVVYQYPSVDLTANPPHVGKLITVQTGFAYQQSGKPATNTTVDVPAISDADHVHVGLLAGEGDAGLTGDTFSINGNNIAHPFTGQTNNFFVSYAQNATNPNWTSNFSTDNVSWTLAPGIVHVGDKSVLLTTTTSGDGYFLAGMNTAIPVPSIGLIKTVASRYTTVGAPLTYTFTVTNTSAVVLHGLSVTDPLFGGTITACNHPGDLAEGVAYQCTATHTITQTDIAAGKIDNTASANGLGEANEPLTAHASAESTTNTSLSIFKIGMPGQVNVGDPFTYTITVTNVGVPVPAADAANVVVTDPLPAGLANPTATASPGVTVTITGGRLTATTPLLSHSAPNNSFQVTVTGTISTNFAGTSIENTATVTAPNTNCSPPGNDPTNCTSTDTSTVLQPAPISITKVTSDPSPKPGETFDYTVQVVNGSDTTTATATVNDTIPADLTDASWVCAPSTGSTCAPTNGTGDITSVGITLLPLGVATFTIRVTVAPTFQGGAITNTATTTPGEHTVCATATSCTDDVPVTVTPEPAPLTITKQQTPTTPAQGGAITYTVVVANTSASTIAHATFTDSVPAQIVADGGWTTTTTGAGTTAMPASAANGFPAGVTLVIAPGGTVTVTISAHVADPYNGREVTNTATATPGTNTECADGQPTCQAEVSFTNPAQLEVAKTHAPIDPHPVPGQRFTYTVTVTNPGNSATGSGTFSDPLPDPPLDAAGATWTCTPSTGSTCGATAGTGSPTGVAITVAPNGGTVTFAITVTIRASEVPVTVDNVGSVTPNPGTACVDGQPTCDAKDTFTATPETALLTIAKSHTPANPTPPDAGQQLIYTVVVTNTGTFTTAHATFEDPVPAQIVADGGWTTTTTGAGTTATPASAATGFPSGVTLVIAPGGRVTFTITAHVSAAYDGTQVTNTATATPTPGTNTGCADGQPTCQAEDSFINPARLEVAKTHAPTNPHPVPGQRFTYTVTVTNPGDSATGSGTFSDPLPDPPLDEAGATWTCTPAPSPGSSCGTASGTGSPTDVPITVAPNGGTVTFSIAVTIRASEVPVMVDNVGSVTPGPGTACVDGQPTCDGDDSFTATPETALLTIAKQQTPTTPAQGDAITYTVVITNTNAFTTAHATFDDPVPAQIVADGGWTTTTSGAGTTATPASAATGFPSAVTLVIAPGGTVTFTIAAHVATPYNGGEVINLAAASPGTNTECADGQDTCQAEASFTNPAQLEVAKTHTPTDPDPLAGQEVTYTVTVTNPGNSATGSGTFSDPLPDPPLDAAGATWTCTPSPSPGSSCGMASGTGSPADVPITVAPNGGTVTFTIAVTITASGETVTVHNVGSVTPGPGTGCVDRQPTCDGEDTFTANPTPAPLTIAKSHEPAAPTQGHAVTYTITVTNTSPTTQAEGTVNDPFDSAALQDITWTAVASPGSTVNGQATDSGTGAITSVPVALAPNGTVTFTVHASIRSDWTGGQVINTSEVTPGDNTECTNPTDPSCSATDDFPTPSLINILKFHLPKNPHPGQTVTYVVIVHNLSHGQPASATINDPLPPQLDRAAATWTTRTFGPDTTATPPSGTGPPSNVAVALGPASAVFFVITAPILTSFAGGTITNTATATPGENTGCKNGTPTCEASTSLEDDPLPATLAISKSADSGTQPLAPGDPVTYTITVTNTSTTTGTGTVTDPIPAGLLPGSWTATATPGSSVSPTSGTGAITGAHVTVAPHGKVTFTRTTQIDPAFTGTFDIDNVATLTLGPNTNCDPVDPTQPCDADAVIHVNTPVLVATPPQAVTPPQQAAPSTPTAPELPLTGLRTWWPVRLALILLAGGGVMVLAARRRRPLRS